jgi:leucine-rich repeat protein SHOC2
LPELDLSCNQLTSLPESIGNLTKLTKLNLAINRLHSLPDSIGNLTKLTDLDLSCNWLTDIPESISNLTKLTELDLSVNQLNSLPKSIINLSNLVKLSINANNLTSLPESIANLPNLVILDLNDNPLTDLSILRSKCDVLTVRFCGVNLHRRYLTKLSEWRPKWLLDENNAEIRRILIQQVGYEKICDELNAVTIDTWREYALLKIDRLGRPINNERNLIYGEPMVLLKMTCPSTAHIHILRVPPEMTSAEAAITWVNHGIHPDKFAVQT